MERGNLDQLCYYFLFHWAVLHLHCVYMGYKMNAHINCSLYKCINVDNVVAVTKFS